MRLLEGGVVFGVYALGTFLAGAAAWYLFKNRVAVSEKADEYEWYIRHIPHVLIGLVVAVVCVPWLYRTSLALTPQLQAELLLATAIMTAALLYLYFARWYWFVRSQHKRYAPSKRDVMTYQIWINIVIIFVSVVYLLAIVPIVDHNTPYKYLTLAITISLCILLSRACVSWQETTRLGKIWTRYEHAYRKTTVFVTICFLLLAAIAMVHVYLYSVAVLILLLLAVMGYALWLVWQGERNNALEEQYAYAASALALEFETLLEDEYFIDLYLHEVTYDENRVEMMVELYLPELRARIENWLLNEIKEILDLATIEIVDCPPELLEEPEGRVVVYVRVVYRA